MGGEEEYTIINVESQEPWIKIFVNRDATNLAYPKEIILTKDKSYIAQAAQITDSNWTNGISNETLFSNKNVILFNYSSILNTILETKTRIQCGKEEYTIIKVESEESWIKVYVDRDATNLAYPKIIEFK